MANKKTMRHKSALKAHRKSVARRGTNFQIRSKVRSLTTMALKAIQEKNLDKAKSQFKIAQAAWQKAAQKGIFHKNVAKRKISRLAAQLATLVKS